MSGSILIYFNTSNINISGIFSIPNSGVLSKYFGIPVEWGSSKTKAIAFLKERLISKLQGCQSRFLSQAGKEILIKSVIQSIPTYIMSIFKLPSSIVSEFQKLTAKFWWSHSIDKSSMHWMSWNKLTKNKKEGGIGFKDLQLFNLWLQAKQAWKVVSNQNAFWSKLLKGIYFPHWLD